MHLLLAAYFDLAFIFHLSTTLQYDTTISNRASFQVLDEFTHLRVWGIRKLQNRNSVCPHVSLCTRYLSIPKDHNKKRLILKHQK